jgi:hypothetical protein
MLLLLIVDSILLLLIVYSMLLLIVDSMLLLLIIDSIPAAANNKSLFGCLGFDGEAFDLIVTLNEDEI